MRISDFIHQSNNAATPEELFSTLEQAALATGFDRVAYAHLTCFEPVPPLVQNSLLPAIVLNYPAPWVKHYFKKEYQKIDPVITYTPRIRNPYLWGDLVNSFTLTEQQTGFMDEAEEAGLRNGITIPLHGPWGSVSAVSYASHDDCPDARAELSRLHLLATQFHTCFMELTQNTYKKPPSPSLTGREQDCLKWVAHGKSSWEIGVILGIQEDTVNGYIKNAIRKLDVSTRAMAVLKAVRLGLIVL